MKTTGILVYQDAVLVAVSAVLDLLSGTNRHLQEIGRPPAFDIRMVGQNCEPVQLNLPARFLCDRSIDQTDDLDLLIVPSFMGEPERVRKCYPNLVRCIRRLHSRGTEIASLCRGSYFLAEAGLLDGKLCTCHWQSAEDMRSRYPAIQMVPDVIITDQDGVYTSGGAFSSIHVVIYLIEKYCGRDLAIEISKHYSIDMNRSSQTHFAVFSGQKEHGDREILNAQNWVEENYDRRISVEDIASQTHMSKRNFIRRFKKATSNTPLEYLQRVKVEAAKKMLEKRDDPIGSLMYKVGYQDEKTFRRVFKRYAGITPQDYRKRYNRRGVNGEGILFEAEKQN